MMDRAREFWIPEPRFAGATVFLLGGGPSLTSIDLCSLEGLRVLAVNEALRFAPFAEAVYFTDHCWMERDPGLVLKWPGLAVTTSPQAKQQWPDRLKRVAISPTAPLKAGVREIRQGRSSGQIAIALAIAMGAARVILLGYDMRLVEGRSHFHDAYREKESALYERQFVPAFAGWHLEAQANGVTVLNATPGSALEEFATTTLDHELEAIALVDGARRELA